MSSDDRRSRGGRLGTALLATVLGVGVGLLAAPQPGVETRRALRKRLDAAREGLEDQLEDLEERSRPMRRVARARAEELGRRGRKRYEEALEALEEEADELDESDEGSSTLGTVFLIGAGIAAATYFFTSERTATARERVREAAATVRDEAEARWDRFQARRGNGQPFADRGTRSDTAESAPSTS
ncbi:MAG TPA: YtxH domain-containing protein [Gemmatimonadales bacterium]|nr:YtxH domain-containing protein [Gemmatimonadales bacterium]